MHPLDHLARLLQTGNPRVIGTAAAAAVAAVGATRWYLHTHRPTPEELERRRRELLATSGRITDGHLVVARDLDGQDSISPTPATLFYSYSLGGVRYNCAQDVTSIPDRVLGYRIDQPVQVRYDPRNPGNSVIVSESWTGLWMSRSAR